MSGQEPTGVEFEIDGDAKEEDVREWRKVETNSGGQVVVTVTLARGSHSAKATARTSRDLPSHKRKHTVRRAVVACRERALEMLEEISSLDLSDADPAGKEKVA